MKVFLNFKRLVVTSYYQSGLWYFLSSTTDCIEG